MSNDDRFEMKVLRTWEDGEGELHTLYARVRVTDTDTGKKYRWKLRNPVDIGWGAFPESHTKSLEKDTELYNDLKDFIREESPIYTGHRQFPGDGKPGLGKSGRGWPYS